MRLTTPFAAIVLSLATASACADPGQPPTTSREIVAPQIARPSAPRQPTAPAPPQAAEAPSVATPTPVQIATVRQQIAVAQANVDNLGNIGEPSTKTLQQARARVSDLKAVLEILLRQQTDAASATPAS